MSRHYRASVAELTGSTGVEGIFVYLNYDECYGGIYACAKKVEFKNGMMISVLNAPYTVEWVIEGLRRCSDKKLRYATELAKKQIEMRDGSAWVAVDRVAKACGIMLNP